MKNLLKFILASLILVSCNNDEENIAEHNTNSLLNTELMQGVEEEDKNVSYYLDGKMITEATFNNLNLDNKDTHYDFPNNKVKIFSSKSNFETYLNSNSKLKSELEANAKASIDNDIEQKLIIAEHGPYADKESDLGAKHPNQDFDSSYIDADGKNYANKLVFVHYSSGEFSIWDTFSISNTENGTYVTGNTSADYEIRGRVVKVFNMGRTASGERMYLRNARTSSVTKTFYQQANYGTGGSVKVVTVRGNTTYRITFGFRSIR